MGALRRDDRGQSRLGVIIVAVLLCGGLPAALWASGGWQGLALVAVGVTGWLGVRRLQSSPADETTDSSASAVWKLIPSRQYGGRHADSGGLARGEQEAALDEINQQAADQHEANAPDRRS
ncbi:hypothetical protein [Halonotius sp. GCM10025705]|uniref:hypothetical protein n=1 Tax=Halonotius sp. GCM10025705 TaxID=3252678 RepID=UPI0036159CD1